VKIPNNEKEEEDKKRPKRGTFSKKKSL